MQFALGPSAWDEIHPAIFKASKILHGEMTAYYRYAKGRGGLLEQFTHEMEPFLRKQCMPVHPDVDHVTVRWIPANTLFAITVSVIDQGLAQKYVYQNQGVSFSDSC
ncbi:hypothetical protein YC2023_095559 [Brassica napus]